MKFLQEEFVKLLTLLQQKGVILINADYSPIEDFYEDGVFKIYYKYQNDDKQWYLLKGDSDGTMRFITGRYDEPETVQLAASEHLFPILLKVSEINPFLPLTPTRG